MKIRGGFVSNSSSSSYIIIGERPTECVCAELNKRPIEVVVDYITNRKWWPSEVSWDGKEPVFLTQFLSDCVEAYFDMTKKYNAYLYKDGSHGGPYNKDNYDLLREKDNDWCNVWILKEHNLEEE